MSYNTSAPKKAPTPSPAPQAQDKAKKKGVFKRLCSFLITFFVCILCLLALMYSSPWGTQASIAIINKFTPINIVYKEGMFSETLALSDLNITTKYVDVDAKHIHLQFHLRCFWQKQLCIDSLKAEYLKIKVNKTEKKSENNTPFSMPIAIKAASVDINNVEISVGSYFVELNQVSTPVDIQSNIFKFNRSTITRASITQTSTTQVPLNTPSPIPVTDVNKSINIATKQQDKTTDNATDNASQKNDIKNAPSLRELIEISLPIQLNINALNVSEFAQNIDVLNVLPAQLNNATVSLNWFENDLRISLFIAEYVAGNFDIRGRIAFADNYPLNFRMKHHLVNNSLWSEVNKSSQNVSLKGDLAQLNMHIKSTGSLALIGEGTVNVLTKKLPHNIKVQASKIPLYNEFSQHMHPSKINVNMSGDLNTQEISLTSVLNGLGYKNANISLKATHALLPQHESNINNTSNNPSNNITNNSLSGSSDNKFIIKELTFNDTNNHLNVKGDVTLNQHPSWNLQVNSSGFTFPVINSLSYESNAKNQSLGNAIQNMLVGKITGNIKGKINSAGIYNKEKSVININNTDLQGNINHIPFVLTGNVDLNENYQFNPSNLSLSIYESVIKLSGNSDELWNIKGELDIADIQKFEPAFFTSPLEGKFKTLFNVTGPIKQPKITFEQHIEKLIYNTINVPSITIKGHYLPSSQHSVNAHISSKSVGLSTLNLTNFNAKINANMHEQRFDLAWQGDYKGKFLVNGSWNTLTQNWLAVVSQSELNYLSHKWQPDKDISVNYNALDKTIAVNQHCWKNVGLSACLTEDVSFFDSGTLPVNIALNTYYFNKMFTPPDISVNTSMNGNADISWAPDQALFVTGELDISAGNVLLVPKEDYLPVDVLSAWDKGRLNFKVDNQSINTHMVIGPDQQSRKNSRYSFYSDVDVKGQMLFQKDFPLNATVKIDNFNLRPFQSMNHDLALLEGILTSKVDISGDLGRPKVTGKVNLLKGRVKSIKSPNIVEDISLDLTLLGEEANLRGTFNIDEDPGALKGNVSWINEPIANINIEAKKLSILVPPQVEATIAPKINATLTKNKLKVTGQVSVLNGALKVVKLPEGSIELTNDVIFVDDKGDEIIKEKRFNIESDIRVYIDEAFALSGQGFTGNLQGGIRVRQNTLKPLQIFGNLNIPDGRYHAYGQRLQIEKGKVSFNGPLNNPHIDIKATRTIPQENIKVGVELVGLANALSLNLISTPLLSRAQILSYLIRGQGLEKDNADNSSIGMALGAALANYSGILKQIDKLPLINNVEIEGDSNQVSIAGYLGKKIYVKYGIGVDEPINELTIRLFLMSRLWLETISGLENSVDLYYSFDTNL